MLEGPQSQVETTVDQLKTYLRTMLRPQVLSENQRFAFRLDGTPSEGIVIEDLGLQTGCPFGIVGKKTKISITVKHEPNLIVGGAAPSKPVWHEDLDLRERTEVRRRLKDLGVGGMTDLAMKILKEAFGSRIHSPSVSRRYNLKHERGMVLYGPPGSGKTFIATKICELLDTVKPKYVRGPELKTSWYGETEENIRNLSKEAIADEELYGAASKLHVIIIDELDSMTTTRGSTGSNSRANISEVTQLLSMIDGPSATNNVFIIGTTNRKDLIDKAFLRGGRFALEFEVGYPNEESRLDILNVLLQNLKDDYFLHSDVDVNELAFRTEGFASSSLSQLLAKAYSCALRRNSFIISGLIYTMQDFIESIEEIKSTRPKPDAEKGQASERKSGKNEDVADIWEELGDMRLTLQNYKALNTELRTQVERVDRRVDMMKTKLL